VIDPDRRLHFPAKVEIKGINPYVLVTAEGAARLRAEWRRPMPVRFQLDGKPVPPARINMMPSGDGSFFLYLNADVRKTAGAQVGDLVTVTIEFDHGYRSGPADPMPPWFRRELLRDPAALRGWDALPPSGRKEILRYFARLKSPEAQQRNVGRALHVLAGGQARFMARSWNTTSQT
jgi:hypothetical protein